MGKKRNWNDDFVVTSMRRRRDPLHEFCDDVFYTCDDVFYTQGITNGLQADIDSQPVKADRHGIFHGTSL